VSCIVLNLQDDFGILLTALLALVLPSAFRTSVSLTKPVQFLGQAVSYSRIQAGSNRSGQGKGVSPTAWITNSRSTPPRTFRKRLVQQLPDPILNL